MDPDLTRSVKQFGNRVRMESVPQELGVVELRRQRGCQSFMRAKLTGHLFPRTQSHRHMWRTGVRALFEKCSP